MHSGGSFEAAVEEGQTDRLSDGLLVGDLLLKVY